jgi:hypothetical protein
MNEITTRHIGEYIEARKGEGATNGTINRELSTLKRMFSLGTKATPPKVQPCTFNPEAQRQQCESRLF